MKNYTFGLLAAMAFFLYSCSARTNAGKDLLYSNSWELEYITGTNNFRNFISNWKTGASL